MTLPDENDEERSMIYLSNIQEWDPVLSWMTVFNGELPTVASAGWDGDFTGAERAVLSTLYEYSVKHMYILRKDTPLISYQLGHALHSQLNIMPRLHDYQFRKAASTRESSGRHGVSGIWILACVAVLLMQQHIAVTRV